MCEFTKGTKNPLDREKGECICPGKVCGKGCLFTGKRILNSKMEEEEEEQDLHALIRFRVLN